MSSDNPFASPEDIHSDYSPGSDGSVQPRSSVDYLETYGKVFENSNWFFNVLILGLVALIGNYLLFIGGIIVTGYGLTLLHAKSTGQTNTYPDFDFNKFGEYLIRGFWMFLVAIVFGLCLLPIFFVLAFIMGALQHSGSDVLGALGTILFFVFCFVLGIIASLAAIPLMLRAGLQCSFTAAFDFAWIKDFISKMWVEQIVGAILLSIISWFVMLVGLVALCIGMIPAAGIVMIAQWNFFTQLYQVYIGRGGQPIPYRDSGSL
ncbi:DUF4013 domain-containing protein [Bremerella cremea]|uniref:DUF4013 domain-containing protein n=1 Tax=Bremerella cremea TaxID=1031537 RepID=A0A368KRW7_9BACT|nr:DUF4013 domain-containing protein [Bremerella cremea]RCS50586.1 DUF4013 domain-containing protein [Bremerella cremea]